MQRLSLKFNNLLFWILIFLLAFIPLYPKFPLFRFEETFVAVRIEDLLIGLAITTWLGYLMLTRKISAIIRDKLTLCLLLFFFIGGLSLFSALFLTHTINIKVGLLHYFRRWEFMILLLFASSIIQSKKQIKIALVTLFVVTLLVNIYALGEQYLGWPLVSTTNSEFSKGLILYLTPGARVNSTFAGHYDLAIFLVMSLILATTCFFLVKKFLLKIALIAVSSLSAFVLVLTAARLSFVAAVLGVGAALLLLKKRMLILVLIMLTLAALIYPSQLRDRFISTLTINVFQSGDRYENNTDTTGRARLNIPTLPIGIIATKSAESSSSASESAEIASDIAPGEPVDTTQLGVYRSFGIRTNLEWPRAIRAFEKNPLLGTGYSSLGLATDNDFLRSLGEVGFLGTAAFILIFVEIIKRVWRNYQSVDKFTKYFAAGTLAVIFAMFTNSLFIDVFEASKIAEIFWLVLGINLAMNKFSKDV